MAMSICKLCVEGIPLKKYFDGRMMHFDGLMAWTACTDALAEGQQPSTLVEKKPAGEWEREIRADYGLHNGNCANCKVCYLLKLIDEARAARGEPVDMRAVPLAIDIKEAACEIIDLVTDLIDEREPYEEVKAVIARAAQPADGALREALELILATGYCNDTCTHSLTGGECDCWKAKVQAALVTENTAIREWNKRLFKVLCNAGQIFDGWAQADPECWGEYDARIRKEITECLVQLQERP